MTKGKLAIVTGASTGIGYELAKCCAKEGFNLLVAADEPEIHQAAGEFGSLGVEVDALEWRFQTPPFFDSAITRTISAINSSTGAGFTTYP